MRMGRARTLLPLVALVALLAAGLAIRLAVLDSTGHYGDSVVNGHWADRMATYGPWDFYRHLATLPLARIPISLTLAVAATLVWLLVRPGIRSKQRPSR